MKIHDILLKCVQDKAGKILTFQEIRERVLASFPDLKPASILPSEHTEDIGRSACAQCKIQPIFKKVGRGFYQVLLQNQPLPPERSIHEKLVQTLATCQNRELNTLEIRERVAKVFPGTHLPSVIPSDHIRGGACKACNTKPLFERTSLRGKYRVLPTGSEPENTQEQQLSHTLLDLIRAYGTEMLYSQPDIFIGHLAVSLLGQRRAFNLLSLGLRERVPIDWLEFSDLVPEQVLLAKLASRLQVNHGLQAAAASQSVRIWVRALSQLGRADAPFAYPQSLSPGALVAEPGSHFAAESQALPLKGTLQTLKLNETATGYQALKKGNRNIALLLCDGADDCLLGVKSEHLSPALKENLRPFGTPDYRCPPAYMTRFSPRHTSDWPHRSYSWYQKVPYRLVFDVFQELDKHF